MLPSSMPGVLFLLKAHQFEHLALKSPKAIEQIG